MRHTVAVLLIVTAGCSSLTAAGRGVTVVTSKEHVDGCKILGRVRETSGAGGAMTWAGRDGAKTRMRNKAGDVGATHVLLLQDDANVLSGSEMIGHAYRCGRSSYE